MTARVITLPRRTAHCSSCGIQHRPLHPSHTLCPKCFSYRQIALHVTAVRRLLGGVR
jgi:hypothetical protein